jgi:O-acetyl-ADP-ribose deacetylase (regulator of RNase III)
MKDVLQRIEIIRGDITKQKVDAIVNAANSSLMGGGGVDGAIHRAGGPTILEECKKIIAAQGSCPPGDAVITTGGNLSARFVIHTVGPVWTGGNRNEPEKLANCYRNSLALAVEYELRTIAFPNISTGIYGYPKEQAAQTATSTTLEFLKTNSLISKVHFVCFDEENFILYRSLVKL